VKIMIEELGNEIVPDEADLAKRVRTVHEAGRQVAVHAVGERAVGAAANAIEGALRARPRDDHRHRIEHCGLLPAGLAPRLARLGVVVVSQPAFVHERGERYLQLVPEADHARLYAFRTLRDAGVAVAAGSDAPVSAPAPLASVAAAIERRTATGRPVTPGEAVGVEEALGWWTSGAAHAAVLETELGSLRPGLRADLVLLPAGALEASPAELRAMTPLRVWRAGREVAVERATTASGA
jgi:predicted amidohydrolase YtcJ